MKRPKSYLLLGAAAAGIAGALSFPSSTSGQAPGDEQAITQLVAEIAGQQAALSANQQAMDQKIALIEENLRIARIYVSRGGNQNSSK